MPELKSTFLGELKIEVTDTYMLGQGHLGRRRLDRLDRGSFTGPQIKAEILPGGMDTLLAGGDEALRPDVRLPLKLDDGEFLLITYRGVRHGPPEVMQRIAKGEQVPHDAYYLRTALQFETASKTYAWLNRIVAVGVGKRGPTGVVYEVHEIL
ncbi:MAG: DUF3237 domain-containing protein [Hyphomicrobiaceae bacterium]